MTVGVVAFVMTTQVMSAWTAADTTRTNSSTAGDTVGRVFVLVLAFVVFVVVSFEAVSVML